MLRFGSPEMGVFSLTEIASIRLPYGLRVERDIYFTARFGLTIYAEAARIAGRITEDEALLATAARERPRTMSGIKEITPRSDG